MEQPLLRETLANKEGSGLLRLPAPSVSPGPWVPGLVAIVTFPLGCGRRGAG